MSHGPATEWKEDGASKYKTRLGVRMFLIYAAVYAAFILISVFEPSWMRADVGSLNVAIVYGFGLIGLAIVLAFVYNHLCTRAERKAGMEEDSL